MPTNTDLERECEICGILFPITHHGQKYCPDCRKGANRKKEVMAQKIIASVRRYGNGSEKPKAYDCVCENCGKHFESWLNVKHYCSKTCAKEYARNHTCCAFCGVNLIQSEKEGIWDNGVWYCNEEHRIEQARRLGTLHICPHCHKEFVGYNKTYCSKECFQADIPRRAAERKAEREKPERVCRECGKIYLKANTEKNQFGTLLKDFCSIECRRTYYENKNMGSMDHCTVCGKDFYRSAGEVRLICSEECALKEDREREARIAKEKAIEEKRREEKRAEKDRKKLELEKAREEKRKTGKAPIKKRVYKDASVLDPAWVLENGLCGVCKTSYKDCSLMQTGFRVKPDGAVYKDSKIISCPIYRG